MPPTRLVTECWLLGNVSEALEEHWLLKFNVEENQDAQSNPPLPFPGRPKLPTKGQALKLMMFLKKSDKCKTLSTADIANLVLEEVYRYWRMANIPVMVHFRAKKKVIKDFEDYQKLVKNKSRNTEIENKKRVEFVGDLEKLLDIAALEAEEKIRKDRVLEKDSKCEDERSKRT